MVAKAATPRQPIRIYPDDMDSVTLVLIVVNLLIWPLLVVLAYRQSQKSDPEIAHLEQKLKSMEHHRETHPLLKDAA